MYRLETKQICDTWYYVDGDQAHMFYLVCPKDRPRHTRWDFGHAVSDDLVNWKECEIALEPGPADAWDGKTLATGSVKRFRDRYYMAFTGNFSGPAPAVGIAVSDDLYHWEKLDGNPVTQADGIVYSRDRNLAWNQPRWRDPWLYVDGPSTDSTNSTGSSQAGSGQGDIMYQFVCAGKPGVDPELMGTVAVAKSTDMRSWELQPPLDVPAVAQDLECPKVYRIGDKYHLLVSITDQIMGLDMKSKQPEGLPLHSTYSMVADRLMGPYTLHGDGRILNDPKWGNPYACEAVCFKDQWYLLGTVFKHPDDLDYVIDPIPLEVTPEGLKAV